MLPHAIANGRNQNGTIAGKLNGTIAAHTPTGWRIVSESMLRETSSSIRPCIVVGIAHAASTISIIRATSARASAIVLPISGVTERASSSLRATSRSRSSNSLRARSIVEPRATSGSAARAARDGRVEVGGAGQRHAREHLAGGGVGHVELAGGGRGRSPVAGDVVVEQAGCGRCHRSSSRFTHDAGLSVHSWSGSLATAHRRVGPAITFR